LSVFLFCKRSETFSFGYTPRQISAIKEITKVDERRKAIFLPPLWVSAKKYSFKLPENYSF